MKVNWTDLRNRIPSKIHVCRGVHYEIVWLERDTERGFVGETRFATRQIALEMGHADKETVHTYLHELAHAISGEYAVGLTETQVVKLEQSIYYILKEGNIFK